MTTNKDQHVKVLFRYHSSILEETVAETMLAIRVDEHQGVYQLDSIPFYGPLIATKDEFYAEYDDKEQMLTYRRTLQPSGNSIVQVVITEDGYNTEVLREEFKALGCSSVELNEEYFCMEIPFEVNYSIVSKRLIELEEGGIIAYAEPCLSEKHGYESEE